MSSLCLLHMDMLFLNVRSDSISNSEHMETCEIKQNQNEVKNVNEKCRKRRAKENQTIRK